MPVHMSWHSPIMQEGCEAMPEPLWTLQTQDCSKLPLRTFGPQHNPRNTSSSIPSTVIPPQQGCSFSLLFLCASSYPEIHVGDTDMSCSARRSLKQGDLFCWNYSVHTSCKRATTEGYHSASNLANQVYSSRETTSSHGCCWCTYRSIFFTLPSSRSPVTSTWNWNGLRQRQ